MEKNRQRIKPWTFRGIKIHFKDGTSMIEESFRLQIENSYWLKVRKEFVQEKIHDFLYKVLKRRDEIDWIELLNKEGID